jgi:hypothetical protein
MEQPKRKNDDLPRTPGWVLFLLGAVVGAMLLAGILAVTNVREVSTNVDPESAMTATSIIATATAEAAAILTGQAGSGALDVIRPDMATVASDFATQNAVATALPLTPNTTNP